MFLRNKLAILCVTASLGVANILLAETVLLEKSTAVTLSSLVQKVYERHPALRSEFAQQQQVNANTDLANALFADVTSVNLNHQNDVIGSSDGLQEWEGSLDMPLWLPGQKQQQLALSDKLAAAIPVYKQQLKLTASAKVRELVWNVVLAENANKRAYQVWQTAQKLQNDVTARVKAGELASTEQLLASTNALELHSQYLLTLAELEHALTTYRHVTSENVLPQHFEESLQADHESDHQHHSTAVISQQHPSLMLLDQQINILRAKQDLARFDGAVNPNLSVGVRSERGGHDESYNNSLGIGISFALDNKVYRQPAIADVAKELADAEIARQQLERELTISLFSHLHDLETKQQHLKLLNEQDNTTQQYLSLQQRAFDLGEIDLVSLLRSQSLANESHNRKQALEIDIKHTIANINQAKGVILTPTP